MSMINHLKQKKNVAEERLLSKIEKRLVENVSVKGLKFIKKNRSLEVLRNCLIDIGEQFD